MNQLMGNGLFVRLGLAEHNAVPIGKRRRSYCSRPWVPQRHAQAPERHAEQSLQLILKRKGLGLCWGQSGSHRSVAQQL
jgi:hypothetical protein